MDRSLVCNKTQSSPQTLRTLAMQFDSFPLIFTNKFLCRFLNSSTLSLSKSCLAWLGLLRGVALHLLRCVVIDAARLAHGTWHASTEPPTTNQHQGLCSAHYNPSPKNPKKSWIPRRKGCEDEGDKDAGRKTRESNKRGRGGRSSRNISFVLRYTPVSGVRVRVSGALYTVHGYGYG